MIKQIELNIFYPHPPERVWKALIDRRALNVWMMKNDFEPRIGHKFKFEANSLPGLETTIYCEVVELEEPKRLAYTWQDSYTGEPSLVIWTLTPVEDGTQLELRHHQAGYAATAISNSNCNLESNFSAGMFFYEPVINTTKLMPKPSLFQPTASNELSSFVGYTNLRDEWSYRLNQKLPDVLLIVDY
ncbi:MAG: SRPBCC domain-containing protein [Xenococcaceae cyanobacterium MO_167.B27]|nr:SRPBCC domain-containing protein [Xenococcaceae cyanobacterium MO_167.B27]